MPCEPHPPEPTLTSPAPDLASAWSDRGLVALTVALFALPPLADLLYSGSSQLFAYLAADSFYYLAVARSFAEQGTLSFDQVNPTNGFHPAWQLTLAAMFELLSAAQISDESRLATVLALQGACMAGALGLLANSVGRARSRVPGTVVLLPLGLYTLLTAWIAPWQGSWWGYLNGMESGFLLLAWAILLRQFLSPGFLVTQRSAIGTGLAMGAMGLARLDHFVALPALALILAPRLLVSRDRTTWRWTGLAMGIAATLLATCMLFARVVGGSWLPVSGGIKSTFPIPSALADTLTDLGPLLSDAARHPELWRHAQLLIPAAVAAPLLLFLLLRSRRGSLAPWDLALAFSATLTLLLTTYDACFVPRMEQGHWYLPVCTTLVTLAAIRGLDAWGPGRRLQSSPWSALPIALLLPMFFAAAHWGSDRNVRYAEFSEVEGPLAREHYGETPPSLVELDDGIITWATGFPALSGIGYTLDREAAEHFAAGTLLDLAHQRGFDRLALWTYSLNPGEFGPDSPSSAIQERLGQSFFLSPTRVAPFRWTVDYRSPTGRFSIYRFEPR